MIAAFQRQGRAFLFGLVISISAWSISSSHLLAAEHIVEIKQLEFVPNTVTVKPGDTIKWINRDFVPHTATAKDGSWSTKHLKKDEAMSILVTEKMKADYFCALHPSMTARLVLDLSQ